MGTRDLLDAVLDRGQHPEPEQVDLEEARIRARVLVPLAELPARHRRRLHGHELDQRPRRDDHPARVLGDMPREPCDLAGQPGERAPARGLELAVAVGEARDLLPHPARVPAVREPREPLELRERETEGLPHVANRAARAISGEARDERGVLAPVALGDGDDELLADVPREVEVDVRNGRQLAVQEATEREVVRDRVDVREPGEVADDRSDRASPSAAGREEPPRRARAAHLERALARELEHLVVEEEEPREPELLDQPQLVVEACSRIRAHARGDVGVAPVECCPADLRELADRRLLAVGEVGVAVAELLRQVEPESFRELAAALGRSSVEGEALEHLLRRAQEALAVPPPLGLAAVERGAAAHRDEHVLEQRPSRVVGVDVARRDRLRRRDVPRGRGAGRYAARRRARTGAAARRRSDRGRTTARAVRRRSGRVSPARAARSPRGRRGPRSAPRRARARPTAAGARGPPSPPGACRRARR